MNHTADAVHVKNTIITSIVYGIFVSYRYVKRV